jgi:hypothetical protein
MKHLIPMIFLLMIISACKNTQKDESTLETEKAVTISSDLEPVSHPLEIQNIFKAHGGLKQWLHMENLSFAMNGKNGKETHTISLKNRLSKIKSEDWTIGYDGSHVWLLENEKDAYKGNARFYHNLMFYFYAMPFVLGDEGIKYTQLDPTTLDGMEYNAIKISYGSGVGDSPEDEYILYYNKATSQMEWLGYTVTYTENKKSSDWHFIRYADWQQVNGLLLPKKLTWYTVENNLPVKKRNDMNFEQVTITETAIAPSVFEKPEAAVISER